MHRGQSKPAPSSTTSASVVNPRRGCARASSRSIWWGKSTGRAVIRKPESTSPDSVSFSPHFPLFRFPTFPPSAFPFSRFSSPMIITRSPLRVTLGGGGTDLPSYYREHGGFLVAAAIDKYVYITLHRTFVQELIIKYSKLERVATVDEIEHPIVREALRLVGVANPHLEITTLADIPAGTGLGSSGSFTTALLKALHAYQKNPIRPEALAEEACHIELDVLHEPIGKQDQYIAAFGGITCLQFDADDKVKAWPLKISEDTLHNLEDNLLLFFTGFARSASAILKEQDDKSRSDDKAMTENLHFVKQLGLQCKETLEAGDLEKFGRLMDMHWQHK